MDDVEILFPISLTTIAILIFTPIFMGIGAIYEIKEYFIKNLYSIVMCSIIIAIVIALIMSLYLKNIFVFFASLFCTSQAIFFLVYYGTKLPERESGFAIIGHMILFIIYVVIAGIDILISLGVNVFIAMVSHKKDKNECGKFGAQFCGAAGAIGWGINLLLLLII